MGSDVINPKHFVQSEFQSTLPHGERHTKGCILLGTAGFNPRSHMGSDCHLVRQQGYRQVSIHAPTWGATRCRRLPLTISKVSIHAPTWGATLRQCLLTMLFPFQSTLPHGERPKLIIKTTNVSCFNPRSHMGSDLINPSLIFCIARFQSTLPHGERH